MKKMKSYLLYPLVLGCVCLVCGGTLATVNYVTKDTIQANKDAVANQAIYNCATKVGKTIDEAKGINDVEVTVEESKPFVEKKKALFMNGEEEQYLYYQLKTKKGFSGSVILGALVSPEHKVITTEFIGGDEDGIGISAAKKLEITINNPYDGSAPVTSGASAGKTLPAITDALDAILADSQGGSVKLPPMEQACKNIGKTLDKDSVKDADVTVEEAKQYVNEKKEIKFVDDEASYYYYDANSAHGFSGKVNFGVIVDSEPKVISYTYIGGDEDSLGLGAAKFIEINLEHPYTTGGSFEAAGGATAQMTFPAIAKAFDAILTDAKGVEEKPLTNEELAAVAAEKIGKKIESIEEASMVVQESIGYASVMNKRVIKFEGDEDTYYFYKLHTKVHESYTGDVEFAVIINKTGEVISYVFVGGTENVLGIAAAKDVLIDLEHKYTAGGKVTTESGATANLTLPAIGKAMDAGIADALASVKKAAEAEGGNN